MNIKHSVSVTLYTKSKKSTNLLWFVADQWNEGLWFRGHGTFIDHDLPGGDCAGQTRGGGGGAGAQYDVVPFKLMFPSLFEKTYVPKRKQDP